MKTCMTVVLSLLFALHAYAGKIDGTWKATMKGGPDGGQGMEMLFSFQTNGDKLSGSIQTPQGEISITNGKIKDKEFSFEVDVNGTVIKHLCSFTDDDTISLKLEGMPAPPDGGGAPDPILLKRQK